MATPTSKSGTTNTTTTASTGATSNAGGASTSASSGGARYPDSIQDALKVLDDALANRAASLSDLVTSEYEHLRSALSGRASEGASSMRAFSDQAYGRFSDYANMGMERGREFYGDIDRRVRSNPWPVLGGVAVGTFALGFLLGKSASASAETDYQH